MTDEHGRHPITTSRQIILRGDQGPVCDRGPDAHRPQCRARACGHALPVQQVSKVWSVRNPALGAARLNFSPRQGGVRTKNAAPARVICEIRPSEIEWMHNVWVGVLGVVKSSSRYDVIVGTSGSSRPMP